MPTAISKDGTAIAYDKTGKGPAIILVNGALAHRNFYGEKDLADILAKDFTVIYFDRRGRGESADTKPYTVEKEIEDIAALIDEAGGKAYLYGVSSGAALSLHAAEKLGPEKVIKLALYEPPYGSANAKQFAGQKKQINELITAGKPGEAVAAFLESTGATPDQIADMKKSPEWREMERLGPTLAYDFEVLGDGSIPADVAKRIMMPTQVMYGEKSFDFMHETVETLGKIIPGAVRKTLRDQAHQVSPEAIAPILKEFFE
ncbi:alpha/beta fold hydrolase [Chitinophaga barathri]|uniref:Alpha/beta hydrolase n=1 Tax=Chitinophaga barathri TaxID=1647451 RepID=A0A3N4MKA7_9BACT|nr:alpha/beta hydrolase [Chitinophaga barathri]RPD40520.1 alpha/beta hydrolase [Chitinophaga barathri]